MTTSITFFRKVLTATAVGVASFSFAQTFEQGGITYNVRYGTEVEVYSSENSILLQGDIVIPAQVEYDGKTYDVTTIGKRAFFNADKITSITLPNSIIDIKYEAFQGCSNLKKINIPQSIENIGSSAFYGCSSLKEIEIPNGISEIKHFMFKGCTALEKIILPESIELLQNNSFEGLSSLKTLVIKNSTPPTIKKGGNVFLNTPETGLYEGKKGINVIVPKGAKADYEATDWRYFNIIDEEEYLSTTENKANTSVSAKVYPNPTTGIFFIDIETETPTTAQIVSITGQNIKSVKLNKGKNQVDISNIASGLYFVKIGNNTTKVIKK